MKSQNFKLSQKSRFFHAFHLVTPSPWPFFTAFIIQAFLISFVLFLHNFENISFKVLLCFFFFCGALFGQFNDVIFESVYQGQHTSYVQKGLRFGFLLFIVSEIFLFFAFFQAFFHSSLAPAIQIGTLQPPLGIAVLNAWEIPLINTLLLLLSGVQATIAHHTIKQQNFIFFKKAYFCLFFAFFLGFLFSCFQLAEYIVASFDISDSVYGSIFYLATGFHGFHVLIGSIFLISMFFRACFFHFQSRFFFGIEAAVQYQHFVDVVQLFSFISIYQWGS